MKFWSGDWLQQVAQFPATNSKRRIHAERVCQPSFVAPPPRRNSGKGRRKKLKRTPRVLSCDERCNKYPTGLDWTEFLPEEEEGRIKQHFFGHLFVL
jgi:hypothetical protein